MGFQFLRPTGPFASQTLRCVAEAQQGGGDIFDIARLAETVEDGDKAGWEKAWIDLAERIEKKAKDALAAGHTRSAYNFFMAANQYWRMSDVFLLIDREPEKKARFQKSQENFRAAAAISDPKIEVISVKCGDEEYDGYFCHPANPKPGKMPVVFLIGGADAFAEEIYFSGRQVLDRGWALLLVDTPGRGSSMYVKGIPTRADYEVPGRACIDYLFTRDDVDTDRIGLIGISMAGYYAPRLAAYDDRIKALVGWSGCYSILDHLYIHCEHLRPTCQRLLGGVDDATARKLLADFTMKDCAQNIRMPTLISHGADDHLMSVDGAKMLFDAIGAKDKTLRIIEVDEDKGGGAMHCSHDYWAHNVPFMLDWLEDRL
jgi:dienelactone hydrolase